MATGTVYTKAQSDSLLGDKSDATHNHDGSYAGSSHNHDGTYAAASHSHDASYYTESEVDDLIAPLAVAGEYVGINAQTGTTYTIVLADVGKLVTCTNAGAITVTLPQDSAVAVPVGARIDFAGLGAGLITFAAGTGATVNGTPSLGTRAQYSAVTAIKVAANTWLVVGDLATP